MEHCLIQYGGQWTGTYSGVWIRSRTASGNVVVNDLLMGNRGTLDLNYALFEAAGAPAKTDVAWSVYDFLHLVHIA